MIVITGIDMKIHRELLLNRETIKDYSGSYYSLMFMLEEVCKNYNLAFTLEQSAYCNDKDEFRYTFSLRKASFLLTDLGHIQIKGKENLCKVISEFVYELIISQKLPREALKDKAEVHTSNGIIELC